MLVKLTLSASAISTLYGLLEYLEELQKILSIHSGRQQMATFIHQLQAVQQRVISAMEATVGREVSLTEGNHRRLEIAEEDSAREKAKKKNGMRLSNKRVQQDKYSSLDCAKLLVTQSHGELDTTSDQSLQKTGH